MRIIREELIITNPDAKNDLIGFFQVDIQGAKGRMNGKRYVQTAGYGTFESAPDDKIVSYSATVWADRDGVIFHNYDSEFEDDYNWLREGRISWSGN